MSSPLPRSPLLMNRDDTALLVVDAQEKLVPLVPDSERLLWNIGRLIEGAKLLGLPIAATEQYPEKLGPTSAELAEKMAGAVGEIPAKLTFSCASCGELFRGFSEKGIFKILVCGIETHVCVAQTALDLLAAGFAVYVPVDATGARFAVDHETALQRLEASGATITTVEAALFEWCEVAGTPEFKQISQLIRPSTPGE